MTSYCRFYAGVWFVVTYAGKVVAGPFNNFEDAKAAQA